MTPLAFQPAPIPDNEQERLAALRTYRVLDTLPEKEFDELVVLAAHICDVPISLVSLVDADRQWFKAAMGLSAAENPRGVSFCAHAMLGDELFVVEDARADRRFAGNPLVVDDPAIRFYAGAPLKTARGLSLGSLCVIDRVPRALTAAQRRGLRTLGRQVEAQLELRLSMYAMHENHAALRRAERQKDELAALIVHDLRGPLQTILFSVDLLMENDRRAPDEQVAVHDIENATTSMHRMVLDLLDVSSSDDGDLRLMIGDVDLRKVVDSVHQMALTRGGDRGVELAVSCALAAPMLLTDGELLRRVLENLLDNALKFTAPGTKVSLAVTDDSSGVEIRVCDEGPGIPERDRGRVFEKQPRRHAKGPPSNTGRGLSLRFCQLAITALGGRIWVESNAPRGACFRLRLPRSHVRSGSTAAS